MEIVNLEAFTFPKHSSIHQVLEVLELTLEIRYIQFTFSVEYTTYVVYCFLTVIS